MVVIIISFLSHLPIYEGTMVVYHFFNHLTGNPAWASLAEKLAVEMADKTISFFLVAVAIVFIRDYLNWNKKGFSGWVAQAENKMIHDQKDIP
jgi:hypothetical protein